MIPTSTDTATASRDSFSCDDPGVSRFQPRDPEQFFAELEAMTVQVYADRQEGDVAHLRRIERWGRLFSAFGYGTAWIAVNPFSVIAMALGISCRWTIMAHHILHRGYDTYPNARDGERSHSFGKGFRRWLHWCDWLPIKEWVHEHNGMHHYRLGEAYDPDVPEASVGWLYELRLPLLFKYLVVGLATLTWKWIYYAPRLVQVAHRKRGTAPPKYTPFSRETWNPGNPLGWRVWTQSWIPYLSLRFGLLPALFLPFGRSFWLAVLCNTFFAELLTSLQSFLLIVPNHAGEDVPRFETPPKNKNEFRLRQIVGSVNFKTGSDWNDFLHGWLNYQIEHHLWPDISLRQYQTWQPVLQKLCERHDVPYCQQSVWVRARKTFINIIGESRMPAIDSLALITLPKSI